MTETKPTSNQKLRYERERRGWSQQEVADRVGTTPLNVGRWERGVTMPGSHFRVKLSEVFEKSPYELGLVAERPPAPLSSGPSSTPAKTTTIVETHTPLWNVPYNRNLFFTGRENILAHLHDIFLNNDQPIALTQPQAISGLGGIGKTQTTVEYAYRYRDNYDAVLWARADSPDLLTSDFLTIAALLNLPQRNEQEQSVVVKAVLRWFDTHKQWLLILDNADHLERVSEFLPSAGKGHVLLTTRAHSTGTIAQRIELEKMGLEEGMLFLLRRMKRLRGTSGLESVPQSVRNPAQEIVEAVDGLPLALDQAGAYIEETGCSLSDYLKFYKTRRNRLLRMRGHNATGHPEPVATTWSLSFEKVEQANLAAAELLRLCAFLHPDEIPEAMIVEGASELGPILQTVAEDELEFNEAIAELRKYSLIKRDSEIKILNIHRLVQAAVRDGLSYEMQKEWAERTIRLVNKAFPEAVPEVEFANWPKCQQYLPHAQACENLMKQWHITFTDALRLLDNMANYLQNRGQYAEAEPIYMQILTIREKSLGPLHPDVAQSLDNLGWLYHEQGKYEQAESLYQRSISVYTSSAESYSPYLASPLNNLALLYWYQNKLEQAEPLYQRALNIFKQAFGPNYPDVVSIINNLARLYQAQGKYDLAERLHLEALSAREQTLGPEHPNVAHTLNGLALLYLTQGKYDQAESFFLRGLTIREQGLGPEHPYVARSLNGLALLRTAQGKYEQAEELFQRTLSIREQVLGLEHPDTANTLEDYANLLIKTGREREAIALESRIQAIRAKQE